jgi:hypothetical protein
MNRMVRISTFILVLLMSLVPTVGAKAIPVLPSSFYGTVKVNQENVDEGVLIQALVDGQVIAEGRTLIYQGDSVYSLDVRGDDSDTATVDGGREGDTIHFMIGGVQASQTGTWHSGTNVGLDLSATSADPVDTAGPTEPPSPTQTAIIPPEASPTPVKAQQLAAQTNTGSPEPTGEQINPDPTQLPSATGLMASATVAQAQDGQASNSPATWVIIATFGVLAILLFLIWFSTRK